MQSEDLPQWLIDIGRRPATRTTGRPVPPISGSVKVAAELDEDAAAKLEKDFRIAIDLCGPEDEPDINGRILDAMTGNRISSVQAHRLLCALFSKFDKRGRLSRVDASGDLQPVTEWESF
jgi:hypothetical protein